jgi:hypothetical protein
MTMAKYLLTRAKVTVNSVDLSNFAFSLDTPDEREQVDVSGFNAAGTREYLPGQRDQSIVVGFLQGFGSGEPHRVLQPLYESGTTFAISILPDSTAGPGVGNPSFGGTASLYAYDGLNGQLNARGEITATFRPASNTGFQWGTT